MNIVVANSVGIDKNGYHMVHVPSRWSLGVKNFTNCGYYPWQLAYTSSLLKRETSHRVKFLDGILNSWDFKTYFAELSKEQPDWLIMESSSRTFEEDLRLAQAVKKAFGTKLIFAGQHPMAVPEEVQKQVDYVCIGEYEFNVLSLIQGKNPKSLMGVYPNSRGDLIDINALPFPEDDDISRMDYHEPNCIYRQIQMYASRGCPRRCNFCAAATLYYDELNWRPRDVKNIVQEITYLKNKYPEMEGVFFDEEVHNIQTHFNISLAQVIQAEGLDHLKYEAMCEYASLEPQAMKEMKNAGYYKIRVGVETGSDKVAETMTLGKKHNLSKLRSMLEYGKGIGLMFYGTFSIGGWGSSEVEDQKTVNLIHELTSKGLMDEVQVSVNTPQPGTDFYEDALKESMLQPIGDWSAFDGNGHVVVEYPHYRAKRIEAMFQSALSAFDSGKQVASQDRLLSVMSETLNEIPRRSKALITRSVRQWMIELLLEGLNQKRDIQADLLGQDVTLNEIKNNPHVNNIYSYGKGFFSKDSLSKPLLESLQANEYDTVLVPMANRHLAGYRNVIEVAYQLKPKKLLGIYADGTLQPL